MSNWYSMGGAPVEEETVQVTSEGNYMPAMRKESRIYLHQLRRMYPTHRFRVATNAHDFGTYLDVEVDLDSGPEPEMPEYWDAQALTELSHGLG